MNKQELIKSCNVYSTVAHKVGMTVRLMDKHTAQKEGSEAGIILSEHNLLVFTNRYRLCHITRALTCCLPRVCALMRL